jgi:hypothetical protein
LCSDRLTGALLQVARHNTRHDCFLIVNGRIYDATPYMDLHPGGADFLMRNAGGDATSVCPKRAIRGRLSMMILLRGLRIVLLKALALVAARRIPDVRPELCCCRILRRVSTAKLRG